MTVEEWIKEERADAKAEGRAEGRREGRAEGRLEGRAEGKAEATLELLENYGTPTEALREKIFAITDLQVLKELHFKAAKVQSIEEFKAFLDSMNL